MLVIDRSTTLTADVDGPVVVCAPDVVLDLNGHRVLYGESPPIQPTEWIGEGPVSQESPPVYSGWPWASVLKDQTAFHTAPVQLPKVREYSALIPCYGPYGARLLVDVLDGNGKIIAQGESRAVHRGMEAVVRFTSGGIVGLVVMAEGGDVWVGPPTITTSRDFGIVASRQFGLPAHLNLPNGSQQAARFKIINSKSSGGVIQRGGGHDCSALFFKELPGFTVENVKVYTHGPDCLGLDGEWGSDGEVYNSTFELAGGRVTNRMIIVSALSFANFTGKIRAANNRVVNSPQCGIFVNGRPGFTDMVLRSNYITQNGVVTDAYGILIAGAKNFEIINNTITPNNGRGILFDNYEGAGRIPTENGAIRHNHCTACEVPNLEYGERMEATALRLRTWGMGDGGVFRNLNFYRNTFEAWTTEGGVWGAVACRIRNLVNPGPISLNFNVMVAVDFTGNAQYGANALNFGGVDPGVSANDNDCVSNDTGIVLGDNESWNGQDVGIRAVGNTIRRLDVAGKAFTSIRIGGGQTMVRDVDLTDTRLQDGAGAPEFISGRSENVRYSKV